MPGTDGVRCCHAWIRRDEGWGRVRRGRGVARKARPRPAHRRDCTSGEWRATARRGNGTWR
ncbi:uncharacterized protein BCN122_III0583 [Burkholderia cenocepacia]|nr:uncharacterized protein BCN122_III0583 [Burkholderia cenocepacia]